jgi:hypothetical protein
MREPVSSRGSLSRLLFEGLGVPKDPAQAARLAKVRGSVAQLCCPPPPPLPPLSRPRPPDTPRSAPARRPLPRAERGTRPRA